MATTKKGLQRVKPPPTNAEISRDLAEIVHVLSDTVTRMATLVAKVDRLITRVEAIDRSQTRHEMDVLAHKPAKSR